MADQDTPTELHLDVEGMTCASCALRIERILSRQDGVDAAVVNYAGQEARLRREVEDAFEGPRP